MKIALVEDIKYVWRYSTYVVQYVAGGFLTAWLVLTDQQRGEFLGLLGITPTMFAGLSVGALILANMAARATTIEFKPPSRD